MLANLVNGLCALATSATRKKEDSLGEKLSQGRVSFDDALSHIYPHTTPRPQPKPAAPSVVLESMTIYEAYRGLAQTQQPSGAQQIATSANLSLPTPTQPASTFAPSIADLIDSIEFETSPGNAPVQGQIGASCGQEEVTEDEIQSQVVTYDNLPALSPAQASVHETYLEQYSGPFEQDIHSIQTVQFEDASYEPSYDRSFEPSYDRSYEQQFEAVDEQAYESSHAPASDYEPSVETRVEPRVESRYDRSYDPTPSCNTFDNLSEIQAELAQQILGNYAETVAPVRRDVLANITSASSDFLAGRGRNPEPAISAPSSMSTSMTALVDRIFSILEPYVHELNQTFRATDLSITFTPPAVVNENVGYDALRRPSLVLSSYRCRISTSRLALVIRGREDHIDFFLLPVESVMGLSKVEDEHRPVMTFSAYAQSGVVYWEVENKPLTEERMERFILMTFEHLLDLTREELLRRPAFAAV